MTAAPVGSRDYRGDELHAMAQARAYQHWIMHFLQPHLGGTIVEVGAGSGTLTRQLLAANPARVIALEPSAHLFPLLQQALGDDPRVELHHATLHDIVDDMDGVADSVVYINVLEHVEDDPAELLDAFRVLRPGGMLLVFVPALPWLSSRFDREVGHHRRYRREELTARVQASGLDVVDVRFFDMLGIVTWFVAMRVLRMRMGVRRVRLYDALAVPMARFIDRLSGPPIGKSLLLVAQRPR